MVCGIRIFAALIALSSFSLITVDPVRCLLAASPPDSDRVTVEAHLDRTALQPGQQAVIAVVIDIRPGFHAQSHKPLDPDLVPLTISMDDAPGVTVLAPQYPPGEIHEYPLLGKVSVYNGRVVVYQPIRLSDAAQTGRLRLTGAVSFQLCDDKSCYPPQTAAFALETTIIGTDQPISKNRPELFAGFDPSAVTELRPATTPARPPGAAAAVQVPPIDWTSDPDPVTAEEFLSQQLRPRWSYGLAMALAFVAGLLFNIMPCVLPVIPLKAIGFYEIAQHSRLKSLAFGGVFSLGLISVFAVLAVLILAGHLTWGQQFSKPWFVWGIVVILLAMSLGLFGLFEVQLPAAVYSITPRHDTFTGNFLFGILTAILATPCTAPLLPGVLAFALTQPPLAGALLVLMVGVGMAFPYFLLSALPELARRFPRSGPWPGVFKQVMGFLVLGTAVYFGAGRLIHGNGFYWAIVPVGLAAAVFLIWRVRRLTSTVRATTIACIIAVVLAGGPLWLAIHMTGILRPRSGEELAWRPFTVADFIEARRQGRVVLVKFTANWCSTCQYVEGTVFRDQTVLRRLQEAGVVAFKADLTAANPPADALLRRLNPAGGIPLTALYGRGLARPVKIESVYDSATLLSVIDRIQKMGRG